MTDKLYIEALRICYLKALDSPDESTQNAAVLITHQFRGPAKIAMKTLACNEPPHGWELEDKHQERPFKYEIFEHAERNAIYKAAARGVNTWGATLVCPWAACSDCARAIVQSKITKLVTRTRDPLLTSAKWLESIAIADEILTAGGVAIEFVDARYPELPQIRRNEQAFQP